MKRILTFALLLCMVCLLAGCGCDHELYWAVTKEPVGGEAGTKEQLCSICGESVATESYTLDTIHDGSTFTLTVEEFSARINTILGQIRPELSCKLQQNSKNNLSIIACWKEAPLTMITPQNNEEEALLAGEESANPAKMNILFEVNTTQQTNDEKPVAVYTLQFEIVQALIMACDPGMTAEDAESLLTEFLEGEEEYCFITVGSLKYYFNMFSFGQTLFNLTVYPAA